MTASDQIHAHALGIAIPKKRTEDGKLRLSPRQYNELQGIAFKHPFHGWDSAAAEWLDRNGFESDTFKYKQTAIEVVYR